jgi:hypothetical protein
MFPRKGTGWREVPGNDPMKQPVCASESRPRTAGPPWSGRDALAPSESGGLGQSPSNDVDLKPRTSVQQYSSTEVQSASACARLDDRTKILS